MDIYQENITLLIDRLLLAYTLIKQANYFCALLSLIVSIDVSI